MKVTHPHLFKLEPRRLKVIFIGYEPRSKAYRLYDPAGGGGGGGGACSRVAQRHLRRVHLLTVEQRNRGGPKLKSIHDGIPCHQAGRRRSAGSETVTAPTAALGMPTPTPTTTPPAPLELVKFATPRTADSTLDADYDDGLVARYQRMEVLLGEGEPPRLAVRELEEEMVELHVISADEPNTFAKAERNLCWLKAMQEEMTSITENKTWSLEDMS